MQGQQTDNKRIRRTVNDLVMAEMFLVQATIESANAIGDGIAQLGKQINTADEASNASTWDGISTVLQRTADEALEPYATRYRYFRKMLEDDRELKQDRAS